MIGIIIQARMNSSRLTGKVMKKIMGKPLLELLIERLKHCRYVDEIIVATTTNAVDDVIEALAMRLSVKSMRGSEEDVLDRYFQAAKKFNLDHIVRITADCPLIDPAIVDKILKYYIDTNFKYDYLCNTLKPTFPDGMDVEIFSFEVLKKIHEFSKEKYLREHVCGYIIENPDQFNIKNYTNDEDLSSLRWTVDTPEDFSFVKIIFERLYPSKNTFHMSDILELIRQDPELMKINSKSRRNDGFLLSLGNDGFNDAERAKIRKIIVEKERIRGI
jgi:spore coat polysaccharide biosynthesis protein SpsF